MHKYIPSELIYTSAHYTPPWITCFLLSSIKHVETPCTILLNPMDLPNFEQITAINSIKTFSLLRSLNYKYLQTLSSAFTSHTFWNRIKKLCNKFPCIPTLIHEDTSASSPCSKAEMLNKYFYSCFSKSCPPTSPHLPSPPLFPCPQDLNCTPNEIFHLFSCLPSDNFPGLDKPSNTLLKFAAQSISSPVSSIFNSSLSSDVFPAD